jgi:hypothetical protein
VIFACRLLLHQKCSKRQSPNNDRRHCHHWSKLVSTRQLHAGFRSYESLLAPLVDCWYRAGSASSNKPVFPFPLSNWDCTAWYGKNAFVRTGSTPAKFEQLLREAKAFVVSNSVGPRVVVIPSWNEWGEGHFVEPSAEHGFGYLEAIGNVFNGIDGSVEIPDAPVPTAPMGFSRSGLFDDFIPDGRSWVGYGGPPGSPTAASYYGGTANLQVLNARPDGTLVGGVLHYICSTEDPMFYKLTTQINGDVHDTVEVKYRMSQGPDQALALYWLNDRDCSPTFGAGGYGAFSGSCAQAFWGALTADGGWHVFRGRIDHTNWRGRIWSVRVDLPHIAIPGTEVEVDHVSFLSSSTNFPSLGVEYHADARAVVISIQCQEGQVCFVDGSRDMETWSYLGSVTNLSGTARFVDSLSNQEAQRFYRARLEW